MLSQSSFEDTNFSLGAFLTFHAFSKKSKVGILSLHLGALLLIFFLFQKRTFPHDKSLYASNVMRAYILHLPFPFPYWQALGLWPLLLSSPFHSCLVFLLRL